MLTRLEPSAEVSATRCGFAAAERAQRAIEREIAEADGFEIAQPGLDLFEHRCGRLCARQSAAVRAARRNASASRIFSAADFGDVLAADSRGQRFGPQPRAAAGRAGAVAAPAAEEHAEVHLVFAAFEPGEEAVQAAEVALRHAFGDQSAAARRSEFANGTSTGRS